MRLALLADFLTDTEGIAPPHYLNSTPVVLTASLFDEGGSARRSVKL